MTENPQERPYADSPAVHDAAEFDPGDPYAAGNATNFKSVVDAHALKQSEIDAATIRQQDSNYKQIVTQEQSLFTQAMEQRDQLFADQRNLQSNLNNILLTHLSNNSVISAKVVDVSPQEVAQDTISARQARDLGEEVTRLAAQVEAVRSLIEGKDA